MQAHPLVHAMSDFYIALPIVLVTLIAPITGTMPSKLRLTTGHR